VNCCRDCWYWVRWLLWRSVGECHNVLLRAASRNNKSKQHIQLETMDSFGCVQWEAKP